jgi:3-hydroxymyristoyl/3-hydroxydecanoyl-(acyl carrier protein) dehydratase
VTQTTNIAGLLSSLGSSSLLSVAPVLTQSGMAITTTLSPDGCRFAYAQGRTALLQRLCDECDEPGSRGIFADIDWYFADPAAKIGEMERSASTLPDVVGRDDTRSEQILFVYVRRDLPWFEGHFPGDPILPAVVQIDWAIYFGVRSKRQNGLDLDRFSGLSRLKFRAAIAPDTVLQLTLSSADESLLYTYESRDGLHSKGKIRFNRADDQG